MKYSLANYILTVKPNDTNAQAVFGNDISIGGEGNYVGSISLSRQTEMWSTSAFATGAWIHNKNLDRHGTVDIELSQLAPQVGRFIQLCNVYYASDYEGFTLTLTDSEQNQIAECIDCYITKIPNQVFSETAGTQTWTFTCGQINYK